MIVFLIFPFLAVYIIFKFMFVPEGVFFGFLQFIQGFFKLTEILTDFFPSNFRLSNFSKIRFRLIFLTTFLTAQKFIVIVFYQIRGFRCLLFVVELAFLQTLTHNNLNLFGFIGGLNRNVVSVFGYLSFQGLIFYFIIVQFGFLVNGFRLSIWM